MNQAILDVFCKETGLTERNARKLIKLAEKAAKEQTKEHNKEKHKAKEATDAVDAHAKVCGITLDWSPGLYPVVLKDGRHINLPD